MRRSLPKTSKNFNRGAYLVEIIRTAKDGSEYDVTFLLFELKSAASDEETPTKQRIIKKKFKSPVATRKNRKESLSTVISEIKDMIEQNCSEQDIQDASVENGWEDMDVDPVELYRSIKKRKRYT